MTLTEFRALAERASPGPWEPWDSLYVGMKAAIVQPAANPLRTIAEVRTNFDDAKFIAAASPTAILALIERLERAEAVIRDIQWHIPTADDAAWDSTILELKDSAWEGIARTLYAKAAAYFTTADGEAEG